MDKHVLVYDKDCGNCSRFKRIVDFLDAHKRLDYLSLTEADDFGLLDSVPRSRRHRSFHIIYRGGRIISGSAAVPDLISMIPSGHVAAFLIRHAPGGEKIVNLIYSMFSRLHEAGSCSYPDASGVGEGEVGEVPLKETVGFGAPRQGYDRMTLRR